MRRLLPLFVLVSLACQLSHLSSNPISTSYPPGYIPSAVALTVNAMALLTSAAIRSSTPTPTPTLAPYEQYTIDFLRKRIYGGGQIQIVETLEVTGSFTRYLIRYPSDGLNIYGFANVPKGRGPFPVIVAIHGLVDPANYKTLDYTTPAVDRMTQAGYIVFHPDLRGYPPSGSGDNLFRVGMTLDVLNLIALIESRLAPPGLLAAAVTDHIGLWGHSMGGDIALRVLTVSPEIKAAVLYSSMSGDEVKNAQFLFNATSDQTFQTELDASPAILKHISPANYYHNITSPVQLYHGTADETIPLAWAQETCSALTAAGVQVDCIYYPGEDHTFRSRILDQYYNSIISFYKKYLSL